MGKRRHYENRNITADMLMMYPARLLASGLLRKIGRRVWSPLAPTRNYRRAAMNNGLIVLDTADLDGEGTSVGQDYLRALLELDFKRCDHLFEFCSGPGYIGYSLLANGFCKKLTLADINPKAVGWARETVQLNNLEHLVTVYESDVLDQIPPAEQWDIVVGNPPHFLPRDNNDKNIKAFDPDWSIHRRFYASVKRHMKPGGHVVMMENGSGSSCDCFVPMIEAAGGAFVTWKPAQDVTGRTNGMYYMVSRW